MGKLFAIAWKDAILRFASKAELLFFIILPVVFTFLLAGGTPSGGGDSRIGLVVVDQAQTDLSENLIRELEKSSAIQPILRDLEEAEADFSERRISALLIIPAGFSQKSLQEGTAELELRQQPNNMTALVDERAVQTAINRISSAASIAQASVTEAEKIRPFSSEESRQAYYLDALQTAQERMDTAPQRVKVVRGATPDQVEYDPAANSSAGQLITWVFIPLLGLSSAFAYERESGTLRRLLTTPTSRATYLLGTIFGQVVIALLQIALLLIFGILVMKLNWGRDLGGLAVMMLAFTLAASALGTTLGTIVKTEAQANGLSIMLGMVMALLGGCWYPLELFPEFVRNIVKILPTTWAMQGLLDLVLRGRGLVDILPEAGVLLGFGVVFLVIGIWRFRYE